MIGTEDGRKITHARPPRRLSRGIAVALVVLGWAALFGATAMPLLASIQTAALGLGCLVTAVVAVLWRARS